MEEKKNKRKKRKNNYLDFALKLTIYPRAINFPLRKKKIKMNFLFMKEKKNEGGEWIQ